MAPSFENGPYNLLSLDGGGIRGVSELVVLHRIMTRIQEREGLDELPKPCDYFHLIGGTSTGGLIAIMLGRLRLSTSQALTEYDIFAEKIFRKKNRKISVSSQFREDALRNAVSEVVQKYTGSDLMKDPTGTPWSGKAFVCAKPSKDQDRGPRRIRAYPSEDDWDKDCRIWEAARATTAAPLYFKAISITSGGVTEDFIDAALGCNNPIAEVLDEAGEILDGTCKLGCVLSLGTGTRPKKLESSHGLGRNFQVFKLLKDYTTDSERTHSETKKRFTDFPSTYFRFSVPDAAAKIGMAKYKKIGELKRMTEEYLDSTAAADVERVVDILCGGTTENVTVGHVRYPNKEQIIMDTRRAQAGGIASRFFTGRTAILEKMSTAFEKRENNPSPRREFLLHGMGGVGKTQIALKFRQIMESEKRFARVFWIDATDPATIDESYAKIASKLFTEDSIKNPKARVHDWMETVNHEWLLIMDNCSDQDLTEFLPECDKGNIVYTSRHHDLKHTLTPESTAEVDEMEEDDAVTLLLSSMGETAETTTVMLRYFCLDVVKELGCLPLAIDHAGAYMKITQCRPKDFLNVFRKQRKDLLKKGHFEASKRRQDQAVYTTFDLSYKVLRSYAKGKKGQEVATWAAMAIKILSVICFYHNEDIIEEMFGRAAECRDFAELKEYFPLGSGRFCLEDLVEVDKTGKWKSDSFRHAAALLEYLSLIKRNDTGSLSMHVLVHSWARERMSNEERESFSLSARTLMFNSIPIGEDPEYFIYRGKMRPHIFTCQRLVTAREGHLLEVDFEEKLATIAQQYGAWGEAAELWKRVIYEQQMEASLEDQRLLMRMGDLAELYIQADLWMEAEALLTEIIARQDLAFPPATSFCIANYHQLGFMYYYLGLFKEAVGLFKEAAARLRLIEGDRARGTLAMINDLIADLTLFAEEGLDFNPQSVSSSTDSTKETEEVLWKQYDEMLKTYGPYSAMTLNVLKSLAGKMSNENRHTCSGIIAEAGMGRCLDQFGDRHHKTADFLHLSARAFVGDGLYDQGVERQEAAVEARSLGVGHNCFFTRFEIKELEVYKERRKLMRGIRKDIKRAEREDPEIWDKRPEEYGKLKEALHDSICDKSSCGQDRHRELIRRLGLKEIYPNGVNITEKMVAKREELAMKAEMDKARAGDGMTDAVQTISQTVQE